MFFSYLLENVYYMLQSSLQILRSALLDDGTSRAHYRAGHTRKASRISKAAVDNCGKGVGNFYLS